MEGLVIVTTEDLITQTLISGTNVLQEIKKPIDAVDPRLLESMQSADQYLIKFDGVKVLSRQSERYPNPTLNHFSLARYLRQNGITAAKAIDLGCGVGFLGNYAAKHLGAHEVLFSDLNPEALNQSIFAYQMNNDIELGDCAQEKIPLGIRIKTPGHVLEARCGPAQETFQNCDAEGCLALAAPMYLPGICEVFPQAFSLFAYTAKNIGARLFIGHSNLASDLVEEAADRFGMSLNSRMEQEIPFLPEYGDTRGRRISLEELQEKGLKIKGPETERRFYHDLMVSELR